MLVVLQIFVNKPKTPFAGIVKNSGDFQQLTVQAISSEETIPDLRVKILERFRRIRPVISFFGPAR